MRPSPVTILITWFKYANDHNIRPHRVWQKWSVVSVIGEHQPLNKCSQLGISLWALFTEATVFKLTSKFVKEFEKTKKWFIQRKEEREQGWEEGVGIPISEATVWRECVEEKQSKHVWDKHIAGLWTSSSVFKLSSGSTELGLLSRVHRTSTRFRKFTWPREETNQKATSTAEEEWTAVLFLCWRG